MSESNPDRSASTCWCVANWRTYIPHPNCPIHSTDPNRCQICKDEECDGIHDEYEAKREAKPRAILQGVTT